MMRPDGILPPSAGRARRCLSKKPYTKPVALKVARKVRRRDGEDVWPYRCVDCRDWHIGHPPGTRGGGRG